MSRATELSPLELLILRLAWGLEEGWEMTAEDIAEKLGLPLMIVLPKLQHAEEVINEQYAPRE